MMDSEVALAFVDVDPKTQYRAKSTAQNLPQGLKLLYVTQRHFSESSKNLSNSDAHA